MDINRFPNLNASQWWWIKALTWTTWACFPPALFECQKHWRAVVLNETPPGLVFGKVHDLVKNEGNKPWATKTHNTSFISYIISSNGLQRPFSWVFIELSWLFWIIVEPWAVLPKVWWHPLQLEGLHQHPQPRVLPTTILRRPQKMDGKSHGKYGFVFVG